MSKSFKNTGFLSLHFFQTMVQTVAFLGGWLYLERNDEEITKDNFAKVLFTQTNEPRYVTLFDMVDLMKTIENLKSIYNEKDFLPDEMKNRYSNKHLFTDTDTDLHQMTLAATAMVGCALVSSVLLFFIHLLFKHSKKLHILFSVLLVSFNAAALAVYEEGPAKMFEVDLVELSDGDEEYPHNVRSAGFIFTCIGLGLSVITLLGSICFKDHGNTDGYMKPVITSYW